MADPRIYFKYYQLNKFHQQKGVDLILGPQLKKQGIDKLDTF